MKFWLILLLLAVPALAQDLPIHYLPGSDDGLLRGHLFTVPVTVNGSHPSQFILDTGIGINLISQALAQQLGVPETGQSFTGQRMSGQNVTVPLSWIPSLSLGTCKQSFVTVGVLDFHGFIPSGPEWTGIEGFLGLRFFQHTPFTVDYPARKLILETPESLEKRAAAGVVFPVSLDDDQAVSLTAFVILEVVGKGTAKVEIDTGSDSLILDDRFRPADLKVKTVEGKDETDHRFTRYFGELPQGFRLGPFTRAPARVMFQKIIHDGLLGDDFLRDYIVTWDLSRGRIILNKG